MDQTYLIQRRCIIVIILLGIFTGVSGFLDFTCYSAKARIDINGDNGMFIGGYKSGSDTNADVTFGRQSNTGTTTSLPFYSSETNHQSASARVLNMPQGGGKTRIGAFYCNAHENDVTERIITIIMSTSSVVRPREISQTVSVGEKVTFVVDKNPEVPSLRWRHNGNDAIGTVNNLDTYTIPSVTESHAGVYECHQNHIRGQGNHAIFLLTVRACSSGKWNPPGCNGNCFACSNGGICDERSGECVCAPGFSGRNCKTVHGRNKWGQDGQLQCAGSDDHGYGCQGSLLCLPHPYGCSCAAGFKGLDCNQECDDGTYGANCKLSCNCSPGVSCLKDTGECNAGICHPDWYGVNCQERCPTTDPQPITNIQTSATGNTIHVEWEHNIGTEDPCSSFIDYIVEYSLSDLESCYQFPNGQPSSVSTTNTEYFILGLAYFSTYYVQVTARRRMIKDVSTSTGSDQMTGQAEPAVAPTIATYETTSYTFSVTWNNIICGSRRGDGLEYEYRLKLSNGNIHQDWQRTADSSALFNGLTECSTYEFEVRALNKVGHGGSSIMSASTDVIAPGPVNSLEVLTVLSPEELLVSWGKSNANNCHEDAYLIQYKVLNTDQCEAIEGDWRHTYSTSELMNTLTNLIPYTTYKVAIKPTLSDVDGKVTELTGKTNVSLPSGPPSNVTAAEITSNTIQFKWLQPKCGERYGPIVAYSYTLMESDDQMVAEDQVSTTSVLIDDLKPFQNYTFSISALTGLGSGPRSRELIVTTEEAVPSAPTNLTFSNISRTSMIVTWQKPRYPNGVISKYSILYHVVAKPYDSSFILNLQPASEGFVKSANQMEYLLNDLAPSTKYEVQITADSKKGAGEIAIAEQFTLPPTAEEISPPPPLSFDTNIGEITPTTVEIQVPLSDSKYVTSYQIRVEPRRGNQKRQVESTFYIAAELSKTEVHNEEMFVVGDNHTYGSYYNPPLTEGETYRLFTGAVSRTSNTTFEVAWSEGLDVIPRKNMTNGPAPIVIPIICIILFLFVIVLVFLVLRRQRSKRNQKNNQRERPSSVMFRSQDNKGVVTIDRPVPEQGIHNNTYTSSEDAKHSPQSQSSRPSISSSLVNLSGPIKLTKFESYVQAKKESQINSFKADFATLPGDNLHPWKAAKKEENIKKNRYGNITTYDVSRVILQPLDGDPHSDFINASFIDGAYEDNKYIASQGPNKASVDDFWRMIWQYNVKKIVMLTMLYETGKVKCQQYWPTKETVVAGVTITPKREENFVDFVIRVFELRVEAINVVREVRQYHFTSWPDMSVPQCPILLNFMKIVNAYQPDDVAPPIIHCSAGVGRTGTYITIDSMLEQAKRDKVVDVYGFVSKMRNKRMKMVQTSSQYKFIFDALLEAFTSGNTSIESEVFVSQVTRLLKQGNQSALTKQFKALDKLTVWPHENKFKGGLDPANASRNRYPDIIPADRTRPFLMTDMSEVDGTSSNYINAAFVNGYRTKDQFIVTQTPLPDTVADIWRLLYDHSSNIIVMLNHLDYKDPSMIKYWPDKGSSANFGPLKVTCVEQDESAADMVVRTFQLSNGKNKSEGTRTIRQFALQTWSAGEDEAQSPDSIIALVRSLSLHYDNKSLKHITVHCIDGVGASCVFCAIMMVLDQIKCSQTIDIFQAVRRLRLIRPQAVRNLAQYTFCYKVIQAHLKSSELYENLQQQQRQSQQENQQIYANYNVDGDATGPKVGEGAIYANVNL